MQESCRLDRRRLLQAGAISCLTNVTLPLMSRESLAAATTRPARAKSVIFLFLHGGAPTQDMFDMKPNAPAQVRGEFRPIATDVPGIEICEHLPKMARWMKRAAVLRAVHHRGGCHNEIPSFTGYESPSGMQELSDQHLPPSMGSVCEYLKPEGDRLPAYVSLPNPLGYTGETGPGAGFLGPQFGPLLASAMPEFDPGVNLFQRDQPATTRGIPRLNHTRLIDGMNTVRLQARRSLLSSVQSTSMELPRNVSQFNQMQDLAYDVLSTPLLPECFDPALIDTRVRERYGNTLFGNSAYIATRLVAAGVKFVNVIWTWYGAAVANIQDFGWDTHEHNFAILKRYLPQLDAVYSSLMEDLDRSGLLDETLVVLTSDFGRTPGVNATAGRDHWMHCYSTILAGAGIRGGTVYGASDNQAAWPVDGPVRPADICATIYDRLGIDPDMVIHDRFDRPHKVAQGGQPIQRILD